MTHELVAITTSMKNVICNEEVYLCFYATYEIIK